MSIAATVHVRPSPGLRLLHAGLCCCVAVSAAACSGWAAQLLCVLAALAGGWYGRTQRITHQLDISGVGQLRLAVQQAETALVLREGSTLWPSLLLLHLGASGGAQVLQVLTVLPDSVASCEWRALSLACRALAARAEIKPRAS